MRIGFRKNIFMYIKRVCLLCFNANFLFRNLLFQRDIFMYIRIKFKYFFLFLVAVQIWIKW